MKHVLGGTCWTVSANFLHPLLKSVHCASLKSSFYKSSIHLETLLSSDYRWLNTILASAWGGRGAVCVNTAAAIWEITPISSPACHQLHSSTHWRIAWYILAEDIFWSSLCIPSSCVCLIKLNPSSSPAELSLRSVDSDLQRSYFCTVITPWSCVLFSRNWWRNRTAGSSTSITWAEIHRSSAPVRPWHAN